MSSDVQRLLTRISAEYEAARRGLLGLAQGTARHDFITKHSEQISVLHEELSTVIGNEQEATRLVIGCQHPETCKVH